MKNNYLASWALSLTALFFSFSSFGQWTKVTTPWETFAHTALTVGDEVWIIGGADPFTAEPIDSIMVLDINTNTMIESIEGWGAGGYHSSVEGDSGIYILGGFRSLANNPPAISDTMRVYSNGSWSNVIMPDVIGAAAVVAAQGKIIVGGGYKSLMWNANNQAVGTFSDDVFIYDEATQTWTTEHLSEPRAFLAAATDGNKVAFAGGHNGINSSSAVVDWYDLTTGAWSADVLSQNRGFLSAIYAQGKFYFAGGTIVNITQSDVVDIWDGSAWTTAQLSEKRSLMGIAVSGSQLLFIGGDEKHNINLLSIIEPLDVVDHLNLNTGVWSTSTMNDERVGVAGTTHQGTVYATNGFSPNFNPSLEYLAVSTGLEDQNRASQVFPNPSIESFTWELGIGLMESYKLEVVNTLGQPIEVSHRLIGSNKIEIETANLPSGSYHMTLNSSGQSFSETFLVQ
ncbi:T9SS type A sorting domain-containing protein [Cryomorphaceae bacterium]|nr:T9SS type A sorting domain-containing protein [Cryomorphaceae bacterium]